MTPTQGQQQLPPFLDSNFMQLAAQGAEIASILDSGVQQAEAFATANLGQVSYYYDPNPFPGLGGGAGAGGAPISTSAYSAMLVTDTALSTCLLVFRGTYNHSVSIPEAVQSWYVNNLDWIQTDVPITVQLVDVDNNAECRAPDAFVTAYNAPAFRDQMETDVDQCMRISCEAVDAALLRFQRLQSKAQTQLSKCSQIKDRNSSKKGRRKKKRCDKKARKAQDRADRAQLDWVNAQCTGSNQLAIFGMGQGGGIAQIAAFRFNQLDPILMTFGAPPSTVSSAETCSLVLDETKWFRWILAIPDEATTGLAFDSVGMIGSEIWLNETAMNMASRAPTMAPVSNSTTTDNSTTVDPPIIIQPILNQWHYGGNELFISTTDTTRTLWTGLNSHAPRTPTSTLAHNSTLYYQAVQGLATSAASPVPTDGFGSGGACSRDNDCGLDFYCLIEFEAVSQRCYAGGLGDPCRGEAPLVVAACTGGLTCDLTDRGGTCTFG